MTRLVTGRKLVSILFSLILSTVATFSFAAGDSGVIQAPPITNTVVQTPDATTLDYTGNPASLAACPASITGCPDINGQGGNLNTCPNQCSVTRTVTYNPSWSAALNSFVPRALKIVPAQCPVGYFPGTQFNNQQDYSWMNPPATAPVSQTVYSAIGGVATCNQGGGSGFSSAGNAFNCSSPTCTALVNNGVPYQGSSACVPNEGSNMVYLTSEVYTFTNCAGSCAGGCIRGTWLSTDHFNYGYNRMSCMPQPGYYANGNTVPASVVCIRSKTQWKQLQQ